MSATNTPGDADSRFRITQPGSYHLTGNVSGVTKGIEIASDDVTIDLNGFTISGAAYGIDMEGARTGIVMRNGHLRNIGANGVRFINANSALVQDLTVTGCSSSAILCQSNTIVRNCVVSAAATGIVVYSRGIVQGCTVNGCEDGFLVGYGTEVIGCTASNSSSSGFTSSGTGVRVSECVAAD